MVLPAWPPLAAPASPALLLKPELLHAGPISAATKRAATTVDILNIWSSVCSPAERQTQSTGLTIKLSSHKLRLGLVTLITRTKGYVACHAQGIITSKHIHLDPAGRFIDGTYPAIAAIARCNGIMAARSRSCRGLEVFANHTRVTSRDSQEADGWTFRLSPTLLPVSKRMDANAHRLRKLRLG
jgi:hypothetical protein